MTVDEIINDVLRKNSGLTAAELREVEQLSNAQDPNAAVAGKIVVKPHEEAELRQWMESMMRMPKCQIMALLRSFENLERQRSKTN